MLEKLSKDKYLPRKPFAFLDGNEVRLLTVEQSKEESGHYILKIESSKEIYNLLNQIVGVKSIPLKASIKENEYSCNIDIVKRHSGCGTKDIEKQIYSSEYIIKESN